MKTYALLLEERIERTKAIAANDPTTEHMAAFGRAIMNRWAANPAPSLTFETPMQRSILQWAKRCDDAERGRH